jgi:DNA-binding transcriptional LysR family regulator
LAQNHRDVDAVRFEMGKTEKVSTIDVTRGLLNSDINCPPFDDLTERVMLELPSVTPEGSINDEVATGRDLPEKIGAMLSLNDSGMNLGLINLNLLIVFDALMHERNLTRAGKRICLSQPAASHALAKLRQTLHDDLFIRTPEGMQPTPRAEQMAEPVGNALRVLSIALKPVSFDPAHSTRRFTVAVSSYAAHAVGPMLARNVSNQAPRITLDFTSLDKGSVLDQLDAGGLDVALTTLVDGGERFKCARIVDDDYVVLLDSAHNAVAEAELSVERVADIPHIVVGSSSDNATGFIDEALEERGLARAVATRASLLSVVLMLVGSDRLAVVPRRVANYLASISPLVLRELPFPTPRIALWMIWHRRLDSQPAHRWLRDMIRMSVRT